MARIRSIKPDFWTSEQVMECSPIARLMFIGMWNFADDHGRLPSAPKTIKAQIFPADDIDSKNVRRMIDELASNGLVQVYVVDEKEYLFITGWHHQKIDKRQPPKYPEPPKQHSTNGRRTVSTDLRGSEGIGEDRIGSRSRAVALDDGWPEDHGDLFWQAYPRKTDKLAAMKKLASVRKSSIVTWPDLMAGVERYAAIPRDPQFTKHAATWLNAGSWADEIPTGGDHGQRNLNAPRRSANSDFFAGMRSVAEDLVGDDPTPRDVSSEVPLGRVNIDG